MPKKTDTVKVLDALIGTSSIAEAARVAKVSRQTVYAYLDDDEFVKALTEKESEFIRLLNSRLAGLSEKCIDALTDALDPKQSNDGDDVRVMALRARTASSILDKLLNIRELTILESKLADLEGRIENNETS